MKMRKKWQAFVCVLSFLLVVFDPVSLYTGGKTQSRVTAQQEKMPQIVESVTLSPGSSYYLDFQEVGGKANLMITSDDPDIVEADSKGKLISKKCGTTSVRVNWKRGKTSQGAVIRVHVKYDRFLKVNNYGKAMKKSSSDSEKVKLYLHRELKAGKTASIKLAGLEEDAEISCHSARPEIAFADEKGTITAKKAGTTLVGITVTQNGTGYSFYEVVHVKDSKDTAKRITTQERNQWFSDSGFIGSSIGVGQEMYFDSQGKGYLGNPVMMVRGCYSFANDSGSNSKYKITYAGKPYQARTAVKQSGVKKVFINMGMNDLWESPERVYKRYVSYLSGIKKDSPGIVIFIESTTPVASGNEQKSLSNRNVDKLNGMIKEYCDSQKDMYYIDVNSCLKGSDGCLQRNYSSDGYVHLSKSGYAEWMKTLCAYTDKLMLRQQTAEDAVKTAQESRQKADRDAAKKVVDKLEKSTFKNELSEKLRQIKVISSEKTAASGKTAVVSTHVQEVYGAQVMKTTTVSQPVEDTETAAKPLPAVQVKKVIVRGNQTLRLSWTKSKGAGYYRIYRSAKKNGKYKPVAGTDKNFWADRKCKKNTRYYYKVRAYHSRSDSRGKSSLSPAAAGHTRNVAKKVVLAGDSVMEGLSAYNVVKEINSPGKKSVVAYRGLGTLTFQTKDVFQGMTGVERVVSMHPDRLYLMLGLNEISYRSTGDMLKNYQEILDQIMDESPETEIVLLAVSPVTRGTIQQRKGFSKIPEWNRQLKKFAKKNGCRYLDYTNVLKDQSGYLKYNGGDGIHWNVSGYHAFAKEIEKYEKKINR